MKNVYAAALLLMVMALPAAAAAPPLPAPKILVIDRTAILQFSKVGQDITRQVQAFGNQAKGEIAGQARALQAEGQALQQQIAILAPDVKQKKIQAFEAKQQSLQGAAQRKEAMIQGGFMKARQTIEQALGPILQQLLQERGGNMILDKSAVIFADSSAFDITAAAVDRLNQKMSSLKVDMVAPPAGQMPQQR